ncbi:hypothetical protein [Aquimarina sp. ERC-38]
MDSEHRLIYKFLNDQFFMIKCRFHYD